MRRLLSLTILLAIALSSCIKITVTHDEIPSQVQNIMGKADSNRVELEKAVQYFRNKGNAEQLESLYFLIKNMEKHSYTKVALYDTNRVEVPFCVTDYPNYNEMRDAMDKIESNMGELSFELKKRELDIHTITAELLIENVEFAWKAWKSNSWSQFLTWDEYLAYVLPYRGSNEPLESFRPFFMKRYADTLSQGTMTTPVEVASFINNDIKSWFTFDSRFYRHPTDQGLDEMRRVGMGRCEDMTNLAIYAMRANGLAVTSDYTPYWANSGNNHAWNAILNSDGKVLPFMGCEANPGKYGLGNKLAKVYRKMYAEQPQNLIFKLSENEKAPGWLRGRSYLDVTKDYVPVSDVTIALDSIPDSTHFAYLCVFNSGDWGAIHWGEIKGDSITYTDMGLGIAYLPIYNINDEFIPAADPFILEEDGSIRFLKGTGEEIELKLISTTRRKQDISTDTIEMTFFNKGDSYELFVWNDDWVSVGKKTSDEKPLQFIAEEGKLYWLVHEDEGYQERIFTFFDGKQVWW